MRLSHKIKISHKRKPFMNRRVKEFNQWFYSIGTLIDQRVIVYYDAIKNNVFPYQDYLRYCQVMRVIPYTESAFLRRRETELIEQVGYLF